MSATRPPPPLPDIDDDDSPVVWKRRRRWSTRLGIALAALTLVVLVGGVSVYVAGEGEYRFLEAVYFSLITVSTVGYGELPQIQQHPWARVVSAGTIVMGLIVLAYFQSTLTALFLEGSFSRAMRRRKMKNLIEQLSDHFILVGCGRVGRYVAAELHRAGHPFVIIEKNVHAVHQVEHELRRPLIYIEGDATDDEVFENAGILKARGLVTSLSLDRDNLFVTLTARTMNPNLRIISKVVHAQNENKLLRAGASTTVSPQHIGGLRLASAVATPHVTEFMERVLSLPEGIRFHEVHVDEHNRLVGKTLREAGVRSYGNLLVVALRGNDGSYLFNPGPDQPIERGSHLIVLGESRDIRRLEEVT